MPRVGFESTIPASKRAKTVHALYHSATMTGIPQYSLFKFSQHVERTRHLHPLPNRRLTLSRLHSVISQKKELFITTAVRTWNPRYVISLSYLTTLSVWSLFSVDLSKYYLLRCLHISFSINCRLWSHVPEVWGKYKLKRLISVLLIVP
jgi:hypothetical protein